MGACNQLCIGTGIRGVAPGLEVQAYPNPFTEGVSVKIESTSKENADIRVYDLAGKLVEEKLSQPVGTETVIGTALTKGMYMVEVKQGGLVQKIKITGL
jgi:hypothetical protein